MPRFLPVPWIRWQRFVVEGVVREKESGRPLPGFIVCAFDKDLKDDDFLGEDITNAEGRFEIRFTDADFKDLIEARPDLYLCVFAPQTREPVLDTTGEIRQDASEHERYEIEIPRASLAGGDS